MSQEIYQFTSHTKNSVVEEIFFCKQIKDAAVNICKNKQTKIQDDLIQELILNVLEMSDEKFIDIMNKEYLFFYSISFLNLSIKSERSPFHIKFKKHTKKEIKEEYNDNIIIKEEQEDEPEFNPTHNFLLNMTIYDKNILNLYIDFYNESHPKKRNPTKIPLPELTLILTKIKEEINSFHWYNQKIFNLYQEKSHTIRSLSLATKIPKSEIHRQVFNSKQKIKEFIQLNNFFLND